MIDSMRTFIYSCLVERLKGLEGNDGAPAIKTINLWNEQVEFIEQEEAFDTPAVFVEFLPVQWGTLGGSVQRAELSLRLHIVTPWKGSAKDGSPYWEESLSRFGLLDRLDAWLFNLEGADRDRGVAFCLFRRTASHTNHNHGELVEDVTDFTCQVTQEIRTA